MERISEARETILNAWPHIVHDSRAVLGSELHYQAMIYHCLRIAGIPIGQLGMNVKMDIRNCKTELFKQLAQRKKDGYREGFEPIPDIVIFSSSVKSDWRRRNCENTLDSMLMAIEVKASERHKNRLTFGEIKTDIDKLSAHQEEVRYRGSDFFPCMLILDTAPDEFERMRSYALEQCKQYSKDAGVALLYCSQSIEFTSL